MQPPRLARDLMVKRLVTVSPEADVFDGIALLLKHRITGAPVIDGERNYLGMLSERCCLGVLALTAQLAADAGETAVTALLARDVMQKRLVTFRPETDALLAIEQLLQHRISGASVVDSEERFVGVFSERYAMSLLMHFAYEGVPAAHVGGFMNADLGRGIGEDLPLLDIVRIFLDKYYRRLPVLRGQRLVGQISRRDVLAAGERLTPMLRRYEDEMLEHSDEIERSDARATVHHRLPSTTVASFMDRHAHTIGEDTDLLGIAQIFLHSNCRRLPVLADGKLVGQISRRDVLAAAHQLITAAPRPERALLYLSAVQGPNEPPPIP